MDKKNYPPTGKYLIAFAVGIALTPFLLLGCASVKKTSAPTTDRYQEGYTDGVKKGRESYLREYGDLLQSCASRDAVSSLNERLTKCKETLDKATEFSRNCLAGAKKYMGESEKCRADLGVCILERDDWAERCGK
jgi:hypothetical protein